MQIRWKDKLVKHFLNFITFQKYFSFFYINLNIYYLIITLSHKFYVIRFYASLCLLNNFTWNAKFFFFGTNKNELNYTTRTIRCHNTEPRHTTKKKWDAAEQKTYINFRITYVRLLQKKRHFTHLYIIYR